MRNFFLLFQAFCLTIVFSGDVSAQHSSRDTAKQATLFETKADIKAFSRRMDQATDDMELTDAIIDLSSLYLRVVGDSRFARSETLRANRGRIAAKLQKASKAIERSRKKAARESSSRYESRTRSGEEADDLHSAIVDRHWQLAAHTAGATGPSMYFASGLHGTSGHFYRGRGGGLLDDNGDELLDLIQTVIHPDFWDVNGGPGRAHYYQPLRIIVVTATQRVHDDMTNLLERLR